MSDLTINERVVCRMLEAAWSAYLTLPAERPDEAMEFRRKLDEAAAVVKMRPAQRTATEVERLKDADYRLMRGHNRPREDRPCK